MQFVDMYVCMRGYLHTYALEGVQTSAFNDCPGVSGQTGSLGLFCLPAAKPGRHGDKPPARLMYSNGFGEEKES